MGIEDIKLGEKSLDEILINFYPCTRGDNPIAYVGAQIGCTPDCPCKKYGELFGSGQYDAVDDVRRFTCANYRHERIPKPYQPESELIVQECRIRNLLDELYHDQRFGLGFPVKKE